jgi:hypothetical protein
MTADPIKGLRIATPCTASWERMEGDERVRHCAVCSLNVYNFAEMTRDEVQALLARTEGRICARLYRRADGTVLTRDCPRGLRELRRRASRIAAATVAALLSVPAFALCRSSSKKPRLEIYRSEVSLTTERVATTQPAAFTGVVVVNGEPVPGVTVTLRNEATRQTVTAVTNANGVFTFASQTDGSYRVDVTLPGLDPRQIEHLELKSSLVTHAHIALHPAALMGEVLPLVPEPVKHDALSITFTQSFIDKLPF